MRPNIFDVTRIVPLRLVALMMTAAVTVMLFASDVLARPIVGVEP